MKTAIFLIFPFAIIGLFILLTVSCTKEDDTPKGSPVVTTAQVTSIMKTAATCGGKVVSEGDAPVTVCGVCWSTGSLPTISNSKTVDSVTAGVFTSILSGLAPGTKYYVRAYATNSKGTAYGNVVSFTTTAIITGTFTDARDGTVYKTVAIGDQVWMSENLKYLPSVVGPDSVSHSIPYYYVYGFSGTVVANAKASTNYKTYGVLYNWTAAMDGAASSASNPSGVRGVCPIGWHLPSASEWMVLIDSLGGESVAGGKLKETDTIHWFPPNVGATNETGFKALPGGLLYSDHSFIYLREYGNWWSATEQWSTEAWNRYISANYPYINKYSSGKNLGFSVRCVKD